MGFFAFGVTGLLMPLQVPNALSLFALMRWCPVSSCRERCKSRWLLREINGFWYLARQRRWVWALGGSYFSGLTIRKALFWDGR